MRLELELYEWVLYERVRIITLLELQMKIWPPVKVSLIVVAAVSALLDSPQAEVSAKIGWAPAVVGLLLFPAIVLIGLFVMKIIFRRNLTFEMPNWQSNPLEFSRPENFFHLAAMVILASGITGSVAAYARLGTLLPIQIAPIALGTGIFLGLWVLKLVHAGQLRGSNK